MRTIFFFALFVFLASTTGVRCALNVLCDTDADCTVTNSYCKKESPCNKGWCLCNRNFKQKDSTTCIKDALIGDSCETNDECPYGGGSSAPTCSSGTCKCPDGYQAKTRKPETNRGCTNIPEKLDAACDYAAGKYCGHEAYCDAGVCKCSSGRVKDNDYDCRKYKYKEACTATSSCGTYRAECKNAVCDCTDSADGYQEVDMNTACLPPTAKLNLGHGEKCDHNPSDMANLKYCAPFLDCGTCPEDASTVGAENYCLAGCSGLQASIITLLVLLFVGYFTS